MSTDLELTGFKVIGERWLAWYTNAYQDREGEIFTTEAIEKDLSYMDSTKDYPYLCVFHIPQSRIGITDSVFGIGRIAIASGTFDDSVLGQKALAYFKANGTDEWRLSHGYRYKRDGKSANTYTDYHTFEISVLQKGLESNPFTAFDITQGEKLMSTMSLTDEKRDALKKLFGDEEAVKIEESALITTKALENLGVGYKAEGEDKPAVIGEDETPAPENLMKAMYDKMCGMEKAMTMLSEKMAMYEKAMTPPAPKEEKEPINSNPPPADQKQVDESQLLTMIASLEKRLTLMEAALRKANVMAAAPEMEVMEEMVEEDEQAAKDFNAQYANVFGMKKQPAAPRGIERHKAMGLTPAQARALVGQREQVQEGSKSVTNPVDASFLQVLGIKQE